MAQEHDEAAQLVIRKLTGGRWTWPPVRVRDVYPLKTNRVMLRGRPVRAIVSVKDFDTQEDLTYTRMGTQYLEFGPETACKANLRVEVVFEYGSEPGKLAQRAIDLLGKEFTAAEEDPGNCRLPDRVTSVNRQGVSYTYADPMAIVERGRTGVFDIDLILFALGGAKKRSAVFSPEYPPPDRLEVTALDVPEGV